MPRLWLKDDTRNPSGSTKDRASQLVVAKAIESGADTIAAASTGNAATALAAVAASAGLRAVVFVPAGAPPAKLIQMLSYGAEVLPVAGSYDDAFELSLAACLRFCWINRNTAFNPFTIEGKKTAALEIAAAMAPEAPDAVVVTAGDGVITAGLAKGFVDLETAGLISRRPRLIVVQPEGTSAIATALRCGTDEIIPVPGAASIADSLVVKAPRNAMLCLREVRASNGAGVIVSDDAILAAIPRLASLTGVFAEPAAAAALAGLETALAEGFVARDERVVLMITGSGMKDITAAARALEIPVPIEPNIDAVTARLAE
jgi:threonine synthase